MSDIPKLLQPLVKNGVTAAYRELLSWTFRIAIIAAIFWIRSTFVTIEKYDRDRGEGFQKLQTISDNVLRLNEKLDVLSDHEKRIRELEHANAKK